MYIQNKTKQSKQKSTASYKILTGIVFRFNLHTDVCRLSILNLLNFITSVKYEMNYVGGDEVNFLFIEF